MKNLIYAPRVYNTSALHRHIDNLDQKHKALRGSASMLYRKLIELNFRFGNKAEFFVSNAWLMAATGFCYRTLQKANQLLKQFHLILTTPSR